VLGVEGGLCDGCRSAMSSWTRNAEWSSSIATADGDAGDLPRNLARCQAVSGGASCLRWMRGRVVQPLRGSRQEPACCASSISAMARQILLETVRRQRAHSGRPPSSERHGGMSNPSATVTVVGAGEVLDGTSTATNVGCHPIIERTIVTAPVSARTVVANERTAPNERLRSGISTAVVPTPSITAMTHRPRGSRWRIHRTGSRAGTAS
jgi:hypothetical protein